MTRKLSADVKKDITGWLFVLPMLICFCTFVVFPVVDAVRTSFLGFDYTKYYWAGISNYKEIFSDPVFIKSILNTLMFVVIMVPSSIILALSLSLLINREHIRAQSVYKAIFYIPGVTSAVSLTLVWKYIFNGDFGLANYLVKALGGEAVNWVGVGTAYQSLSLILLSLGIGANIVVITAGLNGIPMDMYEAAYIDGAKGGRVFWNITIPMLKPTLLYVIVTATIAAFQVFVIIMLMTGGGPAFYTTTMLMLIYNEAFQNMNIGKACAEGIILCIIVSLVAVIQFKFLSSDVEY